jgi:hypothetical protein
MSLYRKLTKRETQLPVFDAVEDIYAYINMHTIAKMGDPGPLWTG